MGVNSLPKTVTRQRRDRDLNPGPSAPESSTLTTRLPSHGVKKVKKTVASVRGSTVKSTSPLKYVRFSPKFLCILGRGSAGPLPALRYVKYFRFYR